MHSNKLIFSIVVVVTLSIMSLGAIGYLQYIRSPKGGGQLSAQNVEGVELYHDGSPYVLNFSQQQTFLLMLHNLEAIKQSDLKDFRPSDKDKLVVYQFGGKTTELFVQGESEDRLVFVIPSWHKTLFFIDSLGKELSDFLDNLHD